MVLDNDYQNKNVFTLKIKDTGKSESKSTNKNKNPEKNQKESDSTSLNNKNNFKKRHHTNQWDYPDFDIEPPENIKYSNLKKDWCRYCGARFASQFNAGPWGARTLCVSHYEKLRKGQISCTGNEKHFPIKLSENTEQNYLNKKREKNEKIKEEELSAPKPKKRLKHYSGGTMLTDNDKSDGKDHKENNKFILKLSSIDN